jgi:hypothetical protein
MSGGLVFGLTGGPTSQNLAYIVQKCKKHNLGPPLHRTKAQLLVFKIDYKKAYDGVNLDFVYEVLELRGFCHRVIKMIKQVTQGGSV